jgi:hypothetical protein
MKTQFSDRLGFLASIIENRSEPLGVGLKRGCWAGVAHSIAQAHGERVTDYFGISSREMKDAIKDNNQSAPERRNAIMRQLTLELAATR